MTKKMIVEVTWLDTMSAQGWKSKAWMEKSFQVEHGEMRHTNVGYLYYTDENVVVIAPSMDGVGDPGDPWKFPRAIVLDVRSVKTGKKVAF